MKENHCHCCGLTIGDYQPWGKNGQSRDYSVCDCCGIEYGYEDSSESSIIKFRNDWLVKGANWNIPKSKPITWSLEE